MCWLSGQLFLVAASTPKLRGYEQKRHIRPSGTLRWAADGQRNRTRQTPR